jgi:hypothetical protein
VEALNLAGAVAVHAEVSEGFTVSAATDALDLTVGRTGKTGRSSGTTASMALLPGKHHGSFVSCSFLFSIFAGGIHSSIGTGALVEKSVQWPEGFGLAREAVVRWRGNCGGYGWISDSCLCVDWFLCGGLRYHL